MCVSARGNFLSTITDKYIKNCNFDMVNNTYCPIFRVGDVVRYAQQNFTRLADKVESRSRFRTATSEERVHASLSPLSFPTLCQGGVIGIKIGWICDLDKADDQCNPSYSFTRLDAMSQKNAVSPGYNFRCLAKNS